MAALADVTTSSNAADGHALEARADFRTITTGTYSCDATVLVRGRRPPRLPALTA
jgi:hypothetical protein